MFKPRLSAGMEASSDTDILPYKKQVKITKLRQRYWWFCDRNLYIQLNKLLIFITDVVSVALNTAEPAPGFVFVFKE